MPLRLVLAVLVAFGSFTASAQRLVIDFDPRGPIPTTSSNPFNFKAAGNRTLFIANNLSLGNEMWMSDGTPEGTTLLKDFWVGPGAGFATFIEAPVEMNGVLYFTANGEGVGNELWKTDGTPEGTSLVKDIGPGHSSPFALTAVEGTLYFQATTVGTGRELWRSDGTALGTLLVKDLTPGTASTNFTILGSVGKTLYLLVNASTAIELWKSDGTGAGTTRVKVLCNCTGFSTGSAAFDGKLYFGANDHLWRSDGTEQGTVEIPNAGSGVSNFIVVGNKLVYFGSDAGGLRVWTFDGTTATPVTTVFASERRFAVLNDKVYFNSPAGIYASDGTSAGTLLLKTIAASEVTTAGGNVYFAGALGGDLELWKTDGTTTGTTLVKNIRANGSSAPVKLAAGAGGLVYFAAKSDAGDVEPYRSDGTAAGTIRLADIARDAPSSNPLPVGNAGNALLFVASVLGRPPQVFRTNGSALDTREVTSTTPVMIDDLNPFYALTAGASTYLTMSDQAQHEGVELWKTDGNTLSLVKDLYPSHGQSSFPRAFAEMNGTLYFVAATVGCGLYRTDGTAETTLLLADVPCYDRSGHSSVWWLTPASGRLFFVAGEELWTSDGTAAGTKSLATFKFPPSFLSSSNGRLYFNANDELWTADGTMDGTKFLSAITPSSASATFRGELFFTASDSAHGSELWKTDGTAVTLVKDIYTGALSSFPSWMNVVGDKLFFFAFDETQGFELWKTDGTESGTQLVRDINPGVSGCGTNYRPLVFHNQLWFTASDGRTGQEPWRSDGTEAGTVRVGDLEPGPAGSIPTNWRSAGSRLYFTAAVMPYSRELWTICDATASSLAIAGPKSVVAGQAAPFTLTVQAECYDGTVHFTSDDPAATLSADGTYEVSSSHGLVLRTAGTRTITVTDTANPALTATATITVLPAGPRASSSSITTSSSAIPADGLSTATITVTIRDAFANKVLTSAGDVTLSTTAGTLTNVVDHGDGTYTATLRSTASLATATITGMLNGAAIGSSVNVKFVEKVKRRAV